MQELSSPLASGAGMIPTWWSASIYSQVVCGGFLGENNCMSSLVSAKNRNVESAAWQCEKEERCTRNAAATHVRAHLTMDGSAVVGRSLGKGRKGLGAR